MSIPTTTAHRVIRRQADRAVRACALARDAASPPGSYISSYALWGRDEKHRSFVINKYLLRFVEISNTLIDANNIRFRYTRLTRSSTFHRYSAIFSFSFHVFRYIKSLSRLSLNVKLLHHPVKETKNRETESQWYAGRFDPFPDTAN